MSWSRAATPVLVLGLALLLACTPFRPVQTKTSSYPLYEMRRVQVGERRIKEQVTVPPEQSEAETEGASEQTPAASPEVREIEIVIPEFEWRRFRVATVYQEEKEIGNRGLARVGFSIGIGVVLGLVVVIADHN